MTNWQSILVELAEASTFSSLSDKASGLPLAGRCSHQACSCHRWRLPVGRLVHPSYLDPLFSPRTSWEFVLNFDYEYSLITRKRKLNRTVPVCSLSTSMILGAFMPQPFSFTWDVVGLRY